MNDRSWMIGLAALVLWQANGAAAQDGGGRGFAGLGDAAAGFATPDPGSRLRFPQDHGAHPAYRIEWWYLTATLSGDDGQDYGVQWTLFRSALAPPDAAAGVATREDAAGWSSAQLWMGHAGVTTATAHYSAERLARGGIGQAGVSLSPFVATIDDWEMRSTAAAQTDPLDALRLTASGPDFRYDLALTATGPLVLHGERGYSVKSERGQASYYYSQPFYRVTGTLTLPDGPVHVTGQGWLDREWSSQPLDPDQTGWDWVSLSFDDGARLMGFQLRDRTGGSFTSGTWISPDGMPTPLPDGALRFTPIAQARVAGREIPVRWQIEDAARGLDITTAPLNPQAWMGTSVPYWEGPLRFTGSHRGRGYLEMTGY